MNERPVAAPSHVWMPKGMDVVALAIVASGLVLLYAPTFWDWSRGTDAQGHEPLIAALSTWLLFGKRFELTALDRPAAPRVGYTLLSLGLLMYVFGRTQEAVRFEFLSLVIVIAGLLVLFKGLAALRMSWFPLVFLLFAAPLPYRISVALTGPVKFMVSAAATQILQWLAYPVGRTGVVITVGQYQLLVTEACAGLQTMFTLEAMGLLYASLMNHVSATRNVLLALAVVPVSFCANVIRVVLLALVTYYLGDAAGQGFLHGFAGMVLFMVALVLIMGIDALLGKWLSRKREVA